MREFRPYGSVRGARSDARPYRDQSGLSEVADRQLGELLMFPRGIGG